MTATIGVGIVLAAATVLTMVLYVFARVRWSIDNDVITLTWYILGHLRFRRRRVKVQDVESLQPFEFRKHWRAAMDVFGRNRLSNQTVFLRLRSGAIKGIVFIPEDRDGLVAELERRLAAAGRK